MTIMYVVTAGSYSDYRICGVFDNKPDAELFLARCFTPNDDADIEEHNLNPIRPEMRAGLSWWHIYLDRDGEHKADWSSCPCVPPANTSSELRVLRDGYGWQGWAESLQHAVKIAGEHRIRHLAGVDYTDAAKKRSP